MSVIGVISDTHGYLDPKVLTLFAGVDHILHAGDVGPKSVLKELEKIAPVTAVSGNCDSWDDPREIEVIVLGEFTFLLRHDVDMRSPGDELRVLLRREKPDVIVFGHTHKPCFERWGEAILFNPGYAGRDELRLRRSVGILHCDEMGIGATHHNL
jgi:putative phosphoesterase